jgi:hypothetical protein
MALSEDHDEDVRLTKQDCNGENIHKIALDMGV